MKEINKKRKDKKECEQMAVPEGYLATLIKGKI
jgi:hypothetical protein